MFSQPLIQLCSFYYIILLKMMPCHFFFHSVCDFILRHVLTCHKFDHWQKKNTVQAHLYAHWGFIVLTNHSSPAGKNRHSSPLRAAPGSRTWWPAGSHTFTLSLPALRQTERGPGKIQNKNPLSYKLHWTKQTAMFINIIACNFIYSFSP